MSTRVKTIMVRRILEDMRSELEVRLRGCLFLYACQWKDCRNSKSLSRNISTIMTTAWSIIGV